MQYRAPKDKKELDTYIDMVRLAFTIPHDEVEHWQSIDPLTPENSRVLADEQGKVLCGMGIVDDGALLFNSPNPIRTALITAVASPPEHRRKGYVRELFLGMFEEERSKGVPLTALYPFYFPFYRSFGYELAHDASRYFVKIDQFKGWRNAAAGTFAPVDVEAMKAKVTSGPGSGKMAGDLKAFDAIYREWANRNLGAIARTPRFWLHKFYYKKDPVPTYLYHAADGRPTGYIIYHFEDKGDWVRDMHIHEIRALDSQTLDAIYGFIYNHDSQATKVVMWAAVDSGFHSVIADPREAEHQVHPGYMLRLLDVEGAFRERTFQLEAEGEFTFSLTDDMLPDISAVYHVCARDGKATAERRTGAASKAGIEVTARSLAQLYGGYIEPVRAARSGLIKVTREADLQGMQAVLSPSGQPLPYMADDF